MVSEEGEAWSFINRNQSARIKDLMGLLKNAKLRPVNNLGLLVLNSDMPHSCVQALVTSKVFHSKKPNSLLMYLGAEGTP